jgi:uncharacterized membrane protein YebE (DUF533 family)
MEQLRILAMDGDANTYAADRVRYLIAAPARRDGLIDEHENDDD